MAAPDIGSVAQDLYEHMEPFAYDDVRADYPLMTYLGGIGEMFQQTEDLARDDTDSDRPGWALILHPDTVPVEGLAWMAQLLGVRLRPGLAESEQRARVRETAGMRRGTPDAIVGAVKQYLTGNKTVFLTERTPTAWSFDVSVYDTEAPVPAEIVKAIQEQKPGGVMFTLTLIGASATSYAEILSEQATYQSVINNFTSYAGVRNNLPGT